MELTVLGRHAPWPPPGGACSGYLVRSGGACVLIDGGPGVAARVLEAAGIAALDAIVVSHLHEDHISDLHCLQFAVMAARSAGTRTGPLPLYAPVEPAGRRTWLQPVVDGLLSLHPLPVEAGLAVGPLRFTFAPTVHPIPCWAMRVEDGEGALFYSADTNLDAAAALAPLAAGADLALVEATYPEALGDRRWLGHLTARDAATLGCQAGVGRLLLTHIWPALDPDQLLAEARAVFPGAEVAGEWQTYTVRRP